MRTTHRDFADLFKANITAELTERVWRTGSGACETLEDYRNQVGVVKGLQTALKILNESLNEFDRDDEDPES